VKTRENIHYSLKQQSEDYGKSDTYFSALKSSNPEKYKFICSKSRSGVSAIEGSIEIERQLDVSMSKITEILYYLDDHGINFGRFLKKIGFEKNTIKRTAIKNRVMNFYNSSHVSCYMNEKDIEMLEKVSNIKYKELVKREY
jgi:hypothetical protein